MSRIRPRRACSSTCRSSSTPSGPDLLEAGRDDDRPADPGVDALADHAGNRRRRRDDDRQVDRLGQIGEARVRPDPQHVRPVRIDRVDRPAERAADQVPEDRPPDAPGLSVAPMTATVWARRSHRAVPRARQSSCAEHRARPFGVSAHPLLPQMPVVRDAASAFRIPGNLRPLESIILTVGFSGPRRFPI